MYMRSGVCNRLGMDASKRKQTRSRARALARRLEGNEVLLERFESILELADGGEGGTLDEVEAVLIEEVRKLGGVTLRQTSYAGSSPAGYGINFGTWAFCIPCDISSYPVVVGATHALRAPSPVALLPSSNQLRRFKPSGVWNQLWDLGVLYPL